MKSRKKRFCGYVLLLLLSFSATNLVGQSWSSIFTNSAIDTKIYANKIVSYDDGFFTLFNHQEGGKLKVLITKFDACNKPIWSRKYSYEKDLDLSYAVIHDNTLTVLAITNFGNSLTRTPVLINMDFNGEILFSYRYFKDRFENLINLQLYNNQYHLFGPTVEDTDGGAHFAIDKSGELIYSNYLNYKIKDGGINFGCTVLKNGTAIRRHNNTLVACDSNQEIIWTKRFVDHDSNELLESKPLALDDGFVQILKKAEAFVVFKMNTEGNIIWSKKVNGRSFFAEPVHVGNKLMLIWKEPIEKYLMYTEIDHNNGSTILNRRLEGFGLKTLIWPQIHASTKGDMYIAGSMANGAFKNIVVMNPLLSDCLDDYEQSDFADVDLVTEDVDNEYEVLPIDAFREKATITSTSIDHFLKDECVSTIEVALDTTLDCNDSYVFDGTKLGTNMIWSDGSTDSIRHFTAPQQISVRIEACSLVYKVNLQIGESSCACPIFAPNTLVQDSTNPENNKFSIYTTCTFKHYALFIYDRWGNLVFQSKQADESWNPSNQDLTQGTYLWYLEYKATNRGEIQRMKGDISVLR